MNTFILYEAKGYKYLRDRKTGDKINVAVDTVIAKQLRDDIEKANKEMKAKAVAEKSEKDGKKAKKLKKGDDGVTNTEIDE